MSTEEQKHARRGARFERLKQEVVDGAARLSALAFPETAQEKRAVSLAVNGLRRRLRVLDEMVEEVRK